MCGIETYANVIVSIVQSLKATKLLFMLRLMAYILILS